MREAYKLRLKAADGAFVGHEWDVELRIRDDGALIIQVENVDGTKIAQTKDSAGDLIFKTAALSKRKKSSESPSEVPTKTRSKRS